jgi:hypothetical protein
LDNFEERSISETEEQHRRGGKVVGKKKKKGRRTESKNTTKYTLEEIMRNESLLNMIGEQIQKEKLSKKKLKGREHRERGLDTSIRHPEREGERFGSCRDRDSIYRMRKSVGSGSQRSSHHDHPQVKLEPFVKPEKSKSKSRIPPSQENPSMIMMTAASDRKEIKKNTITKEQKFRKEVQAYLIMDAILHQISQFTVQEKIVDFLKVILFPL